MPRPRRRLLVYLGAATYCVGVVVGLVLLESAATGAGAGSTGSGGPDAARSGACAPQPCADAQGYRLQVTDLTVTQDQVTMLVSFTVEGAGRVHAQPADFALTDAAGRSSDPHFDDAACPRWTRTNISEGGSLGPLPLCFRPRGTGAPLTLNWSPDEGLLCCQVNVPLTRA